MVKAGFYGKVNRVQRWKCQQCGKRFAEPQEKLFDGETRLPKEKVLLILHLLVEVNHQTVLSPPYYPTTRSQAAGRPATLNAA